MLAFNSALPLLTNPYTTAHCSSSKSASTRRAVQLCASINASTPKSSDFRNLDQILSNLEHSSSQLPVKSSSHSEDVSKFLPSTDKSSAAFQQIVSRLSENSPNDSLSDREIESVLYESYFSATDEYNSLDDVSDEQTSTAVTRADAKLVDESLEKISDFSSVPQPVDGNSIKRRLSRMRERKKSLTVSRGTKESEYHRRELPPPRTDISDLFAHVTREVYGKDDMVLHRAMVIDFEDARKKQRAGAIVKQGVELREKVMRIPFVHKPYFGMMSGMQRAYQEQCRRCGKEVMTGPGGRRLEGGICQECWREIYVMEAALPDRGVAQLDGKEMWDEWNDMKESYVANAVRVVTEAARMSADGNAGTDSISKGSVRKGGTGSVGIGSSDAGSNGSDPPKASRIGRSGGEWHVPASDRSLRTVNPIRNLVQNINVTPNPSKSLLRLSVGDPTVYGNLRVSEAAVSKLCEVVQEGSANGYSVSMGIPAAREAVAKHYSVGGAELTANDVVLTSGTSGALELALGALVNQGDNVLLPRPGFPLFRTLAENFGAECRYYSTNPDKQWEVETEEILKLADERTRAIVVNNPSNPCGSVYSRDHLEEILAVAGLLRLPVIADEVYADMVFSGEEFVSMGAVSRDVPVLVVGGLSKQFVVPGWRLGWVLLHDRGDVLEKGGVRKGIRQLTTRMLVPNTPIQSVVPTLLEQSVHKEALADTMKELEAGAKLTMRKLENVVGIRCIKPQGAMYVMAEIDLEGMGMKSDMEFVEKLLEEEAVFMLPGECFGALGFVRIVFAAPKHVLEEAFDRIEAFCTRHMKMGS